MHSLNLNLLPGSTFLRLCIVFARFITKQHETGQVLLVIRHTRAKGGDSTIWYAPHYVLRPGGEDSPYHRVPPATHGGRSCQAQRDADQFHYVHWSLHLLVRIRQITGAEFLVGASAVACHTHFSSLSSPFYLGVGTLHHDGYP